MLADTGRMELIPFLLFLFMLVCREVWAAAEAAAAAVKVLVETVTEALGQVEMRQPELTPVLQWVMGRVETE